MRETVALRLTHCPPWEHGATARTCGQERSREGPNRENSRFADHTLPTVGTSTSTSMSRWRKKAGWLRSETLVTRPAPHSASTAITPQGASRQKEVTGALANGTIPLSSRAVTTHMALWPENIGYSLPASERTGHGSAAGSGKRTGPRPLLLYAAAGASRCGREEAIASLLGDDDAKDRVWVRRREHEVDILTWITGGSRMSSLRSSSIWSRMCARFSSTVCQALSEGRRPPPAQARPPRDSR